MNTTPDNIIFSRNKGLVSEQQQKLLAGTCIAIAGTGGDGGLLAERLVRFGIGKIILADPDVFEPANTNRQFAAHQNNYGRNKAEAVAEHLLLINPAIELTVYTEGVTNENVKAIVSAADVIVDEIEYSLPAISVLLHKECRAQNKYVFMGANVGWGATFFCFEPNGKTFEEHFEYDERNKSINPLRYISELPCYINNQVLDAVLAGEMPAPALSSSVGLVSSVLSTEIILSITRIRKPAVVPEYLTVDLFNLTIIKNRSNETTPYMW